MFWNLLIRQVLQPILAEDRKVPLVWEYLTNVGKKTVALAIPFSYPPDKLNGILTTGLGTPSKDSDFAYPQSIKDWILKKYPKFDVDFDENSFDLPEKKDVMLAKVWEVTETLFEVAKDLYNKEKYDAFLLVFRSVDVIQHYFFNDKAVIKKFYRQVDDYIGWFIDNLDKNATLLVVSDHGAQKAQTKFFINNWLNENGFLQIKKNKNKMKIDIDKLYVFAGEIGFKNILWKIKRMPIFEKVLNKVSFLIKSETLDYLYNVDWEMTQVYCLGTTNGLLFFNQIGREPNGIVSFEERYTIYKEFRNAVKKVTYKGKPVVKKVLFRDEFYGFRDSKDDLNDPDIIVLLHEGFTFAQEISEDNKLFGPETIRSGEHALEGVFAVYPKKSNTKTNRLPIKHIYDIVPTILTLLKIPKSNIFDGKSIL